MFSKITIKGFSLPAYILLMLVLIAAMATGKLPNNILGAAGLLILVGNLLHYIGEKLPIIKDYLGGGAVVCIFGSAALATFNILPQSAVDLTKSFVNDMGFLDFYIAALICGAIFGMNRDLFLKASLRIIPVAFATMLASALVVVAIGQLISVGFGHAIFYIALPALAGGIGAGVVPLSSIYAGVTSASSASFISQLVPASALTNTIAIILAALICKAFCR